MQEDAGQSLARLTEARTFAEQAHGAQRYGERPYLFHLDMVVSLLTPYGTDAQVIGYLHDVVEDTPTTREVIVTEFGEFIAECVALLTDEPGATRKDRKAKTYRKLSQVAGSTQLALVVKAADRLANVKSCVADGKQSLLRVYRDEHPTFRKSAYRAGLCDPLWNELDELLCRHTQGGSG